MTMPSRDATHTPTSAPARRVPRVPRWAADLQVKLYRWSDGRIGGRVGTGRVLLLTTTGRRSGQPHTVPLNYFEDGQDLFVVASNSGSDRPPAWYLNLTANPQVGVQIGRARKTLTAVTASAEERARLWPRLIAQAPLYARYQRQTSRVIPLVLLREEAR